MIDVLRFACIGYDISCGELLHLLTLTSIAAKPSMSGKQGSKDQNLGCGQRQHHRPHHRPTTASSRDVTSPSNTKRAGKNRRSRDILRAQLTKRTSDSSKVTPVRASEDVIKEDETRRAKSRSTTCSERTTHSGDENAGSVKMPHVVVEIEIKKAHNTDMETSLKKRIGSISRILNKGNHLRQSFMAASTHDKQPTAISTIMFDTYNSFVRPWANVCFGINPSTAPCQLLFDTESPVTWISENIYKVICSKSKTSKGKDRKKKIMMDYQEADGIQGHLYRSAVSIGSKKELIEKQEFVLVSENDYRTHFTGSDLHLAGILGFGRTAGTKGLVVGNEDYRIVSVLDNLVQKLGTKSKIAGFNLKIPSEASSRAYVQGEVHVGNYDKDLFEVGDPIWAPMNESSATHILPLNMKLAYEGENITDCYYSTLIDSGSPLIIIPQKYLENYIKAVEQTPNCNISVEYQNDLRLYYLTKESCSSLKDIELNFEGGRTRTLPKEAQVIPSSVLSHWIPAVKPGRLYLIFNSIITPFDDHPILLGLLWMIRYYIVSDLESRQVGIAEVEGKTDYVWRELRS
ncbi:acid protease [Fomitiporia mediterranea MF3/22]|uniref:acid protease n=1 Tax=Fomitiporia mediterranea (strain MF3/22) TaxID=694068 RepID=UPI0004407B2D|nr:acid protease [Fomitiporia mediterranea MF3/22]EJD02528.1 acid protease [Fomitiporia mediterranea MF3/22]